MGNLTKNFGTDTDPNLCCPCCGQCKIKQSHMDKLQQIRDAVGVPFGIPEGGGYRCEIRDSGNGAHPDGTATDLTVHYKYYYQVVEAAIAAGMTGIGIKNKGSGNSKEFQIHLDSAENLDGKRPRPWIWTY